MQGFVILLVLFIVAAVICGPIALIIIAVTSGRLREIAEEQRSLKGQISELQRTIRQLKTTAATEEVKATPPTPVPAPVPVPTPVVIEPFAAKPEPARPIVEDRKPEKIEPVRAVAAVSGPKPVVVVKKSDIRLEERIGTRWILIAGVVTSFIGVAFFLKFAYENGLIGPLGRTIMATIAGLACLVIGEVTRRRGYELVAKGVTALGFAILYVTVFFTCKWLDPPLIGIKMAFVLAAVITAAAMTYAVALDEIWIAGLSLLGGFLSPAILSTGVNAANALFGYVLVLGGGACACAIFRKWRVINALAFFGTWMLYAGWFMKFYVSPVAARAMNMECQLPVAMAWLGVFFAVYLVMPLLHGLVKGVIARREDVVLVAANASIVFGYAAKMLYEDYRHWLAFAAVVMAAAHAAVALVSALRSREDKDLRLTLLTIATAFVTMAVPLYFETNAVVLAWAAEAVILVFIGLRYGSLWTQIMGVASMALAVWKLVFVLPWHTGQFTPIFNSVFGTWLFVIAAIAVCHVLYRRRIGISPMMAEYASQLYYCAGVVLLIMTVWQEWHSYYNYNAGHSDGDLLHGGDSIIMALGLLLAALRPLRPAGPLGALLAGIIVTLASMYIVSTPAHLQIHAPALVWAAAGIVLVFAGIQLACTTTQVLGTIGIAIGIANVVAALPAHTAAFTPIANGPFVTWCLLAAAIAACHVMYRFAKSPSTAMASSQDSQVSYCEAVVVLGLAASLEWWSYLQWNHGSHFMGPEQGQLVILAAALLAAATRPLRPLGAMVHLLVVGLAAFGSMYSVVQFGEFHDDLFVMFFNTGFLSAALFVAAAAASARYLYEMKDDELAGTIAKGIGTGLVVLLWLLVSMEIYWFWYWQGRMEPVVENWQFMMQMCISISWAVYAAALTVIGFWRGISILRYMALGLFALLLGKVFIIDTSSIKNVYRMGAFLATGIILVLVSYLYQFLKKKGFFELKP